MQTHGDIWPPLHQRRLRPIAGRSALQPAAHHEQIDSRGEAQFLRPTLVLFESAEKILAIGFGLLGELDVGFAIELLGYFPFRLLSELLMALLFLPIVNPRRQSAYGRIQQAEFCRYPAKFKMRARPHGS